MRTVRKPIMTSSYVATYIVNTDTPLLLQTGELEMPERSGASSPFSLVDTGEPSQSAIAMSELQSPDSLRSVPPSPSPFGRSSQSSVSVHK